MSSTATPPRRPGPPRRRGALLPAVVVVVAVVVLLVIASQVVTEVLWYRQVGFTEVYTTRLLTQAGLFVVGGLVMAAAVLVNLRIAYRSRPIYAPVDAESANLDRYRESLEPLRRLLTIAVPVVLGLFAGSAAAGQWQSLQLFLHRQSFGTQDAEFGHDIGLYVFTLPFVGFLVSFLTAVVLLSGIGAAVTHYLYGGLRLQGRGPRTTPTARIQLSLAVAALVLLQAASYYLDRYSELTGDGRGFTGAGYTAVNAVIPARGILAGIAVLVAGLFVYTAFRGSWRIAAMGVAVMLVTAIVGAGVVPYVVQRFRVTPNQLSLERDYIQRAIASTRQAYDLDDTEVTSYEAVAQAERGALQEDAQTTANIRLLDPALVSPAFEQQQRQRQYYTFPDPLDVDRYELGGSTEDTVIGVRELDLDGLPAEQRSWVNDHTVYTHGYGVVAAYGNRRQDNGAPVYLEGSLPPAGSLGDYEPRIYFGEESPDFSIVGGSTDAPQEFDYPTDAEGDGGVARTTYTGDGGPQLGSFLSRLMYAVKFQDQNILLSNAVNDDSQILYDRDPRDRVQKVAPFLTLDGDPYPAVVDGRVQWIVDAYTTSEHYPYSSLQPLGNVTRDSQTVASPSLAALPQEEVNYIRNSVKATVDAYSGEVQLYAWDDADPVLKAWGEIFPDALTPLSEMSGDLMSHVRYPDDLFKVQRTVLGTYHVTDPSVFYSGSDEWQVPNDPTVQSPNPPAQPPYYLTLQMPGQEEPAFSLTSTYIPNTDEAASNILTGFVAVDGDAGGQAGVKADTYGQMRLLQLPRNLVINGPGQVQNNFNSAPNVSTELNILSRGNSEVKLGNLLTLPVGGGLLYVQPVYVQSSGETSYPLLRRVLVSFGDDIGFAETLDAALDQVFGGDSGAVAGDAGTAGGAVTDDTPTQDDAGDDSGEGGGTQVPEGLQAQLQQALQDAQAAIGAGQQALSDGDFAAYGESQQQLSQAVTRALQVQEQMASAAQDSAAEGAAPAGGSAATGTGAGTEDVGSGSAGDPAAPTDG